MTIDRRQIPTVVLIAATAVALYLCYVVARPFLSSLVWALALAVFVSPFYKRIAAFVKNRDVAAGLATFFVAVLIVAPLVIVTRELAQEIWHNVQSARHGIESGEWRARIEQIPYAANVLNVMEGEVDMRGTLENSASQVLGPISEFFSGTVWLLLQLLITFLALFFFFRDGDQFLTGVRWMLPLSDRESDAIFRRVTDTLYATVFGEILLSITQGVLGGLMFWVLGIPAPFLWGFIMAVLAFLPLIGTWMIWLPTAVYLIIDGHWIKGVVLIGWGVLVLSLLTSVLYPMLIGDRLRLNTLLVFIAIFGGVMAFGMVGIILGPLVLAITISLIEIWKKRLEYDTDAVTEVSADRVS